MSESVLSELQLLISMYDRTQIRFHDPDIEALIDSYCNGEIDCEGPDLIKSSICVTCKLNCNIEIDFMIPAGYPENERLSAFCRIKKQGMQEKEQKLNTVVTAKIINSELNSCDILTIINFINEEIEQDLDGLCEAFAEQTEINKDVKSEKIVICRIWIHSHHIYNKNKRKFLIDTAAELDLKGFSLPGKPGFVCVEGNEEDCDEYWSRVRHLNWQKISLIDKQFPESKVFLESFEELLCGKSEFMKYLQEKQLSSTIKDYLGF